MADNDAARMRVTRCELAIVDNRHAAYQAWAEYRNAYGVPAVHATAAFKAFVAGWDAARSGEQRDDEGVAR